MEIIMNDNFVENILSEETKAAETYVSVLAQMRHGPIPRHTTDSALLNHFAERLEKALVKEIQQREKANELLTNSQYLINSLMAHSNLAGSPMGVEIRKLKRNISDFLNSVPEG